MSAEKPEPGDVWEWSHPDFGREWCVVGGDGVANYYNPDKRINLGMDSEPQPEEPEWAFFFNVFALLSGDPSAWAAALRFLPDPFLLEVGEGEEKRQVIGMPKGLFLSDLVLEEKPRDRNGAWLSVKRRGQTYYADLAKRSGRDVRPEHVEGRGPDFATAVTAALKGEDDA